MFWEMTALNSQENVISQENNILCSSVSVDLKAYHLQLKVSSSRDILGIFRNFQNSGF